MSMSSHEPSTPRAGTIVWGILLALTGLAVLALGLGVDLDLQAVLIVLLAVAGVGLLVKALVRPGRGSEPAEVGTGGTWAARDED
ncbi:hypothetical protein [Georgenia wangjunii]|uniref:hypothetical protein n=1 Tax=Georgenia wangjunii TaxID=3117730 RepID=UPI002F269C83